MKIFLNSKNLIFVLLLIISIVLSAVVGLINIPTQKVSAETTDFEERCKQFTDSDYLLNEDGTLSDMTIVDYGNILNKKTVEISLEQSGYITKVVPEEYLLSSQKVIQYMGVEYGFIVIHEGGGFSPNAVVIIIDFDWEKQSNLAIDTYMKVVVNAFFEYVDLGAGKGYWNTTGNRELVSDTFRLMNVKYMASSFLKL